MEDLTAKYPYYVISLIEEYHKAPEGSPDRRRLRARMAANIGDKKILEQIAPEEAPQEKPGPASDSSFSTIDNFLEKFGGDGKPLGYMMSLQEAPKPSFSLREYIKNKRYEEAIQIIERQNLINPDKNIYFADQIRFLRKLIAIENFKTKPKG